MSLKIKCSYSPVLRLLLASVLALVMLILTGGGMRSQAASGFWRGTYSNIWNRDDNWIPAGYPNAAGEVAFFDGGDVPTDVVISSTQVTVGGIVIFNNTSYLISGENGGSIRFQSTSSYPANVFAWGQTDHEISAPIQLASDLSITNYASGELTFSGDIGQIPGSDFSVNIREGRPIVFLGNNVYAEGTKIRGGTLLLGNNHAAGSGPIEFLCSTDPCYTTDVPSSLGTYNGNLVLQNPLVINHSYVQFVGSDSISVASLDSSIPTSARVVIEGTLNLAKLQDPTYGRNLRRSGSGTLNLNITPQGTNIGAFIRSDPGSGQMNLYGSGRIGRIYYRDGSGGGVIGVGDTLNVVTGELTRSTGILTVTGVLQTGTNTPGQPDRVLSFDLRGTEPGSGYDQIVITELPLDGIVSTAQITDTVLSVAVDPGFRPPVGTEFTLISRTGGDGTPDDAIYGTFRDLPDGSIFLAGDLPFQVFYTTDTVKLKRCENPILTVTGGSPQSTPIGMPFPERLEVTAQYPDSSPVVGLPLYFTAPSSGASATFTETMPVLTGPDGKASVGATANLIAGSYEVTASARCACISPVTFQLTNNPAVPAWLELSGFPSPIRAGESGTFTVTVRDQWNQIITDYVGTVSFSSSDPSAALPVDYTFTLADAGQRSFTATFFKAGPDNFLRVTDIFTPTLTGEQTGIEVLPADPARINVVSGSPQATQVAITFAEPLVVQVTDAYSNTISGVSVTFSSPETGAGAVFTGTNPALTDLTGQASLVAGANTVAGSYQVTATIASPGVMPASFMLTNLPGPVVELRVYGFPSPVLAGTLHSFTVEAVDRYGNVNPAYRGATYSLSSDPQAILPADYLFNVQDAGRHIFYAIFRTAGTHYITIVDNFGFRGTQSGIVVEPLEPAYLRLDIYTSQSPQSTPVTQDFPKPLAVVLTDIYGNPRGGYFITFTVPISGASAILTGANPQLIGSDGRASLIATANTIAGSYTVTATTDAPGVAPYKFILTNLPGPASTLTYISGSMQETPLGKPFGAPLVVEVADAYGNLVPNVWVSYSAPASGPSCILDNGGMALTGADGRASLSATANMNAGSYVVEARVVGVADPVQFYLINKMFLYLPVIFR